MSKLIFFLIPFTCVLLSACGEYYKRESPQLRIEEGLDTIWIRKEHNHGYYEIRDTLTLYAGWPLLDTSLCGMMEHRNEPIWSPSETRYECTISDFYPPFQVFKKANSDTLIVIKAGKIILFKMK